MLSRLFRQVFGGRQSAYSQVIPTNKEPEGGDDSQLWLTEKKKPQIDEGLAEELFLFALELQIHHNTGDDALYTVFYTSKMVIQAASKTSLSSLFLNTIQRLAQSSSECCTIIAEMPINAGTLQQLAQLATLIASYFPKITTSAFSQYTTPPSNFILSLDSSLAFLTLSLFLLQFNLPTESVPLFLSVTELLLSSLQTLGLAMPYDAAMDTRRHYATAVRAAMALLTTTCSQPAAACSVHDISILVQTLSPTITLVAHNSSTLIYNPVCRDHWWLCYCSLAALEREEAGSPQGVLSQGPQTYSRIRSALSLSAPAPRELVIEASVCFNLGSVTPRMRFLMIGVQYMVAAGLLVPADMSISGYISQHPTHSLQQKQTTPGKRRLLVLVNKHEWLIALTDSVKLLLGGSGDAAIGAAAASLCPVLLEVLLHFFLHRELKQPFPSGTNGLEADQADHSAHLAAAYAMAEMLAAFSAILRLRRGNVHSRPRNSANSAIDKVAAIHGIASLGLVRTSSSHSVTSTDGGADTYSSIGGSLGATFGLEDDIAGITDSMGLYLSSSPYLRNPMVSSSSSPSSGGPVSSLPPTVSFGVGDFVDGLCLLPNGTMRWFPATCVSISSDLRSCNLQYKDGENAADKSVTEVRRTKSRSSKGTIARPLERGKVELAGVTSMSAIESDKQNSVPPTLKSSLSPRTPEPSVRPSATPLSQIAMNMYVSPPSAKTEIEHKCIDMPKLRVPSLRGLEQGSSAGGTKDFDSESDDDSEGDANIFEIPSVFADADNAAQSSTPGVSSMNKSASHSKIVARLQLQDLPVEQSGSGIFGAGSLSSGIILDTPTGQHALSLHSSRLHSASSLSRPPTGALTGRLSDRRAWSRSGSGLNDYGMLVSASEQKPSGGRGMTPITATSFSDSTRMLSFRDGLTTNRTGRSTARIHSAMQGARPRTGTPSHAPLSEIAPSTLQVYTLIAAICLSACCALKDSGESTDSTILQSLEDFLSETSMLSQSDPKLPNVTNYLYLLASTMSGSTGRRVVTLLGVPPLPSVPMLQGLAEVGARIGYGAFGTVQRVQIPPLATPSFENLAHSALNNHDDSLSTVTGNYAVKRVPRVKSGGLDSAFDATFNEIAVWDRLMQSHVRGVVQLISYGVVRDEYWLVMALAGRSLRTWRSGWVSAVLPRKLGQPTPNQSVADKYLCALLLELCVDCSYIVRDMHGAGVVHFDLKGDNFLVSCELEDLFAPINSWLSARAEKELPSSTIPTLSIILRRIQDAHSSDRPSGLVLLTDFGESLAACRSNETPHSAKEPTDSSFTFPALMSCKGTLPIQAPEMLSLNSSNPSAMVPPSLPADMWSLGCLWIEVLIGQYLFHDKSWTEMYVMLCLSGQDSEAGFPNNRRPVSLASHLDSQLSQAPIVGPELDIARGLVDRLLKVSPGVRMNAVEFCVEAERVVRDLCGASAKGSDSMAADQARTAHRKISPLISQWKEGDLRSHDCLLLHPGTILDSALVAAQSHSDLIATAGYCSIVLLSTAPCSFLPSRLSNDYNSTPSMLLEQFEAEQFIASGVARALASLGGRCARMEKPSLSLLQQEQSVHSTSHCVVRLVPSEYSTHPSDALSTIGSTHILPIPVFIQESQGQGEELHGPSGHSDGDKENEACHALGQAVSLLLARLLPEQRRGRRLVVQVGPLNRQESPQSDSALPSQTNAAEGSFFSLMSVYTAILLLFWWENPTAPVDVDRVRSLQWIGILPPSGVGQILALKGRLGL